MGGDPAAPDAFVVPPPLIPLEANYEWTYQSTRTRGEHSDTATITQTMMGMMTVDGRDAGALVRVTEGAKGSTTSTVYVAHAVNADEFEMRGEMDGAWSHYPAPVDGMTWNAAESGDVAEVTWHRAVNTNVVAGSFVDCWAAVSADTGTRHTYCRDVGEVLTEATEANGTVTRVELMAKSF